MSEATQRYDQPGLLERVLGEPCPVTTMVAAAGLLCIGAVMVLSAQSWRTAVAQPDAPGLWSTPTIKQVGFAVAALLTMVAVAHVDHRWLARPWLLGLRPVTWLVLLSIALLALAMVPGIGVEVNGARRWLPLGLGIRFQPSELAKLAIVLWLAQRFGTGRASARRFFTGLLPAGFLLGIVGALVGHEDFGTAALLGAAGLGVLTAAGMNFIYLVFLGILGGVGMAALILMPGKEYRIERIKIFLDPWVDPMGMGYHPIQSMLAIASGGWTGKGFGASLQKFGYLPEAHNDFIFAIICEEMGFIGAALVVALFCVIIWQGASIVAVSRDDFARLAAFGIVFTIGLQAAMNIAVVSVVVPTKGIALPLVSAGGTSLIVAAASVGLLASIARRTAGEQLTR